MCTISKQQPKGQWDYVPINSSFVARELKNAGFRTAHYGKWHLGCTPDAPLVNDYGFDDSVTYVSDGKNKQFPNNVNGTFTDRWFPANSSRQIVDLALSFINNTDSRNMNGSTARTAATPAASAPRKASPAVSERPFYVDLWFHISHAPMDPSPDQLVGFNSTTYCPWSGGYSETPGHLAFATCPIQTIRASQHEVDKQIGRVLDELRANHPNTVVVFSGDNGPEDPHIYFNAVGSAGIFRGRKRSLYEGGISVPLIAWWPGKIKAGVVSNADMASIDWLPTVARLAGITLPSAVESQLRGRDASSILLHLSPSAAAAGGEGGEGSLALAPSMAAQASASATTVPKRKHPLVWDYRMSMPGYCYHQSPRLAILDPETQMKLLMHPDKSRVELYNLTVDHYEENNLASSHPALVDALTTTLLEWVAAMPKSPHASVFLNPGCVARPKALGVVESAEERFAVETDGMGMYMMA